MKPIFLFFFFLVFSNSSLASELEGGGGLTALGYAWANNPSTALYNPSAPYSFNSSGRKIAIRRHGVGRYSVKFYGLGGFGNAGGHVQVTGYGASNARCKVTSWNAVSGNFIASVRCFQPSGLLVDSRYNIQVSWGSNI